MKFAPSTIFLVALFFATGLFAQQITVTVAGKGPLGFGGDGGAAKQARINAPCTIGSDRNGNIYFSEWTATVGSPSLPSAGYYPYSLGIQRLSLSDGKISSVNIPSSVSGTFKGIAVSENGDLYIHLRNKVQKIDFSLGIAITIAGADTAGYAVDSGSAASALFNNITGICLGEPNNLYIVDGGNNRIRSINLSTGYIKTIAGTGVSGFDGDGGAAVAARIDNAMFVSADHNGNIYFGDQGGSWIRRINTTTGIIDKVVGPSSSPAGIYGFTGLHTSVGPLSGIACDNSGNVIFNEWSCSCRKWNPVTDTVYLMGGDFYLESFANDTTSAVAYMSQNAGLWVDDEGDVYITDAGNNRIRKIITLTSKPRFAFSNGQSITPCRGVAYPIDSLLWITDKDSGQVETWSVVSPPLHGSLSGFPTTTISNGYHETVKPVGLTYLPSLTYYGQDSFKVSVSDGSTSDTITIFSEVIIQSSDKMVGDTSMCPGETATLLYSLPGGSWFSSNSTASVGSLSGIVTAVAPGIDTISYKLGGHCDYRIITINPLPPTGVISGGDSLCPLTSHLFTSSVPGGTWHCGIASPGTISLSGSFYASALGSTVISYTTANAHCSAYTTRVVNIFYPSPGTIVGASTLCQTTSAPFSVSFSDGAWSTTNSNATISPAGIVTALSIGTVDIEYTRTTSLGCSASSVFPVTIVPFELPLTGSIVGSDTICENEYLLLTNSVEGGRWAVSNSNIDTVLPGMFIGVNAGTAIISYTTTNTCGSASALKTITVKDTPLPPSIIGPDSLCVGQTLTLNNLASIPGIWSLSNAMANIESHSFTGENTVILRGMSPGILTVWFNITENGCTGGIKKSIDVIDCELGVESLSHTATFEVWPVPTSSKLSIRTSLPLHTCHFALVDALSRIVLEGVFSDNSNTIDVSDIPAGVYILVLHADKASFREKILISK
jgi:hypothetical protein